MGDAQDDGGDDHSHGGDHDELRPRSVATGGPATSPTGASIAPIPGRGHGRAAVLFVGRESLVPGTGITGRVPVLVAVALGRRCPRSHRARPRSGRQPTCPPSSAPPRSPNPGRRCPLPSPHPVPMTRLDRLLATPWGRPRSLSPRRPPLAQSCPSSRCRGRRYRRGWEPSSDQGKRGFPHPHRPRPRPVRAPPRARPGPPRPAPGGEPPWPEGRRGGVGSGAPPGRALDAIAHPLNPGKCDQGPRCRLAPKLHLRRHPLQLDAPERALGWGRAVRPAPGQPMGGELVSGIDESLAVAKTER